MLVSGHWRCCDCDKQLCCTLEDSVVKYKETGCAWYEPNALAKARARVRGAQRRDIVCVTPGGAGMFYEKWLSRDSS